MQKLWAGIRFWRTRRLMPSGSGDLSRQPRRVPAWWISSSKLISSGAGRQAAVGNGMTSGKKLYVNCGIILSMVVVLFLVNLVAVQREHAAKAAATASLELANATNEVRFQMMQNRLYLSNYLLSGDTREVERMTEGLRILNEKLQQGKQLANSEQERAALTKVEQLEQSWGKEFAQPLIDKRKDVDSGNATVAELQIYYLQKDASSWVKNSTDALDVADLENRKLVEQRRKSDESASTYTILAAILSTLFALGMGGAIAFNT